MKYELEVWYRSGKHEIMHENSRRPAEIAASGMTTTGTVARVKVWEYPETRTLIAEYAAEDIE